MNERKSLGCQEQHEFKMGEDSKDFRMALIMLGLSPIVLPLIFLGYFIWLFHMLGKYAISRIKK